MVQLSTASAIIIIRLHHTQPHPRDVTPALDDVTRTTNASSQVGVEPVNPQSVIVGGPGEDCKLLCAVTVTVRRPSPADDVGSGSVHSADEDKNVDEGLIRWTHFIFRNRMKISQRC